MRPASCRARAGELESWVCPLDLPWAPGVDALPASAAAGLLVAAAAPESVLVRFLFATAGGFLLLMQNYCQWLSVETTMELDCFPILARRCGSTGRALYLRINLKPRSSNFVANNFSGDNIG